VVGEGGREGIWGMCGMVCGRIMGNWRWVVRFGGFPVLKCVGDGG